MKQSRGLPAALEGRPDELLVQKQASVKSRGLSGKLSYNSMQVKGLTRTLRDAEGHPYLLTSRKLLKLRDFV
jgi:hypothetical protein